MGSMFSKIRKNNEESSMIIPKKPSLSFERDNKFKIKSRLKSAKARLNIIIKKGLKVSSWIVWIAGVSVVVLITPVAFQYEKECQLFEMQAQFFQAQQAANAPQLN